MTLTNRKHQQLNILDASIPARTLIFSLVIPSFIEELGQILTMYVDTAMVGHISVNASAAIAVNTGPLHVASAIGIPVVLLEGSSRLPLWQPPRPPFAIVTHQAEIPCAPCHQVGDGHRCRFRCMGAIEAGEVLGAYDSLRTPL